MSTRTKEDLIRLFMFDGQPYQLSYQFRKENSGYKEDLPVLREMMKEGTVKLIDQTSKKKLFQYTPKA